MKSKIHYIASPNDVTITRDGDCARIEYKEEGIPATHLEVGPEIAGMSDGEILEAYNECLRNDARLATERNHVAFEMPLGTAQIEYFSQCDQWVPRQGGSGDVRHMTADVISIYTCPVKNQNWRCDDG
jgi:hypothetical protein